MSRFMQLPYLPPVPGETPREAARRRARNTDRRRRWESLWDDRCAECSMVRFHVSHEMDPENSVEGPQYHADFPHHAFLETDLSRQHLADYLGFVQSETVA